jgi:hypothetical protein
MDLIEAVIKDDIKRVVKLLQYPRKDLDFIYNGRTPLHYAIQKNNKNIAKILLDAGAKPNATTRDYLTPLHHAVTYANDDESEEMLKLFLRAYLKLGISIPNDLKLTTSEKIKNIENKDYPWYVDVEDLQEKIIKQNLAIHLFFREKGRIGDEYGYDYPELSRGIEDYLFGFNRKRQSRKKRRSRKGSKKRIKSRKRKGSKKRRKSKR